MEDIKNNEIWGRNLIYLWIEQLFVMIGFSAMQPFVPLFIKNELCVGSEADVALYVSLYSALGMAGYMIANPIWGALGDKYGIKIMLIRGTFLTGFLFPLMGYVPHPSLLILLRFLTAACAGTTSASQIMITKYTPQNRQGFALGAFTTAYWGGAMLGYVVGGMAIHYFSFKSAFILCGVLYLVAGIFVLLTKDPLARQRPLAPAVSTSQRKTKVYSFPAIVWMMFIMFLFMGLSKNFELPYIALKIEEITGTELAAKMTGVNNAYVAVGAILSGVVVGILADRISEEKLFVPILIFCAITMALHNVTSFVSFTVFRVILYLGSGGIQPILQKMLSQYTPIEKRGGALGLASSIASLGGVLASFLGGWVYYKFQLVGIFWATAGIFAVMLPVYLFLTHKIKKTSFAIAKEKQ